MPAFDQQIGTGDNSAIGRRQHRGVVTYADYRILVWRQQSLDCRYQAELTEISNGNGSLLGYGSFTQTPTTVEDDMVQAYILVQTEVGKAADVATSIGQIAGVTQADDVTGPYDVIVRAEAGSVDELGRMIVKRLQMIEGITRTVTCPVVNLE